MSEKVETLVPNDPTGLRNNIAELLECAQKKELEAIVIVYRRTDVTCRTYWSGDDFSCIALAEMAKHDILQINHTEEGDSASYDPLPKKE